MAQDQRLNYKQIYYLDIRQVRQDNNADYQALVDHLSEYLSKDEAGNPRIFVHDVTAVRDGEIVDRFVQEPSDEEVLTPETYWTPERRERGIEHIEQMIRQLQSNQWSYLLFWSRPIL